MLIAVALVPQLRTASAHNGVQKAHAIDVPSLKGTRTDDVDANARELGP